LETNNSLWAVPDRQMFIDWLNYI
jgi:hypothetical protein